MGANISATVLDCQQRRFWTRQRRRISVAAVPATAARKAKPTAADKAAAERLRRIWDDAVRRSRDRPRAQWLTQETAALLMDMNQSAVSQYLNGYIPLNYRAVLGFAHVLGVDPAEIRDDLPEQRGNRVHNAHAEYSEWEDVQGFAQQAGLGTGMEPDEYAEAHKLKFRAESLRRKGLFAKNLAVFYGKGDSMLPRIKDGDALLFDTSDTRPADGRIFVIQLGRELFAKRCEVLDDVVYLRSDNPEGDHAWRKPKRMDNARHPITLLGRVRWIGSWED